MKRQLLFLFALSAVMVCLPMKSASAVTRGGRGGNFGHGGGIGHGHSRGFGGGIGGGFIGGGYDGGWDIAELYRELYNNLPFYALHPPVYYSEPVPRTYGYSPFAYGPEVMTPDVVTEPQPVTIDNPYVPLKNAAPAEAKSTDRSAATTSTPEPLVIVNPFVTPKSNVAKSGS